jgi:YesN/AraC family two-component response regulator
LYTVIIADDEVHLREALISGIGWEGLGFSVIGSASNGEEALELVEELEPDLLLTDIKMPFVTGIELAKRARDIRPALNIAFISGYDDFNFAREGIKYGVISYILRPVSTAEMTRELAEIKAKMDAAKPVASPPKEMLPPSAVSEIVENAMDIIQSEYADKNINLSMVAERLHISVSYFCALFKREKQDTFVNMLNKRRMEKAKELLLETRMSVSEISEKCGYSDIFYFSYCFKKCHKIAPSRMRPRHE